MRILKPSRVILMILFCRVRVLGFFSGRSLSRGYKPRNLGIKMDSDLPKPHPDILGKQVIVLAGATSVGKSACAVQLCKHIDAEIIIADSVQVYRHLDIGSNKPSAAEMAAIPHHLVNIREPHETVSSGDFVRLAVPIIFDILSRGKTPIIVGGSTMWLQWLVSGMPDAPKADEEAVKEAEGMLKSFVDSGNWDGAVSVVAKYDRQRSEKLGRNDWYRLHRYLEVALCVLRNNGRKNNDSSIAGNGDGDGDSSDGILPLKRSHDDEGEGDNVVEADGMSVIVTGRREKVLAGIDVRCFFLSEDREELYRYIDTRCESMLKAGE